MKKACVVLEIPSLGEEHDILIPDYIPLSTAVKLLSDAVGELSGGRYIPTNGAILCRRDGMQLLHPAKTLADYGISDGEHLMLF